MTKEITENWILNKINNFQVLSFTYGFFLAYRLSIIIITHYNEPSFLINKYGLNIWFILFLVITFYFVQWSLFVWVAAKYTTESMKTRILTHPIITIALIILCLIIILDRLSVHASGGIINIFQTIVDYGFISFIAWSLVCWITGKFSNGRLVEWSPYKRAVELVIVFSPIIYKIALSMIVAFTLFSLLLLIVSSIFGYGGHDLNKILGK